MNENKLSRKNLAILISLQIIVMGLMFSAGLLTQRIIYQRQSSFPIFTQAYQLVEGQRLEAPPGG